MVNFFAFVGFCFMIYLCYPLWKIGRDAFDTASEVAKSQGRNRPTAKEVIYAAFSSGR